MCPRASLDRVCLEDDRVFAFRIGRDDAKGPRSDLKLSEECLVAACELQVKEGIGAVAGVIVPLYVVQVDVAGHPLSLRPANMDFKSLRTHDGGLLPGELDGMRSMPSRRVECQRPRSHFYLSEKGAIFRTNRTRGKPVSPMPRARSSRSLDAQVARRVARSLGGTVFTPASFTTLGSREAIDKALQRLVRAGILRRLSRGLYDKPRYDDVLGILWPSVDAVVRALAGKHKMRVQPAGVYAANLLGLSEQVPAKVVLLTDGVSRTVRAGPMRISLKRTSPRNMAAANRLSGLVIQAFKSLGQKHITPERLAHLRKAVPATERARLLKDLDLAPGWMRPMLRDLGQDGPTAARKAPARKAPH
jgi:Family of unknown function (DUF6088)